MSGANDASAEYWSGQSGLKWITHVEEQDRLLSAVAEALVARAAPATGSRVLDVGCGAGAVTKLMAEAVGSEGRVLATDIARPFVQYVAAEAGDLRQVGTFLGDAQTADWPETGFDLAVSRFGVMFFADPAAAFANISRALKPGGRMIFAAWDSVEANPYWRILAEAIDRQLGPRERPGPRKPGPMGFADADWTLAEFEKAGLTAKVETAELPLLHDGGAEGAAKLMLRIGRAGNALAEAGASDRDIAAFLAEVTERLSPYVTDGQARIPASIHFYTAETA